MAKNIISRHGKVSRIGQLIGGAFENVVIEHIKAYLQKAYPDYVILDPEEGKKLLTLEMRGGVRRQLDTVVVPKDSHDPVALLETKWLKDARHWNDKGAWILQLREIKMNHATVRGAVAILAGYWKKGVGVLLQNEGGIRMVLVATDEEVYGTFQTYLDEHLGDKTFQLDAAQIRGRFPIQHLDSFYDFMSTIDENRKLVEIAKKWLMFDRTDDEGNIAKGADRIEQAVNELLSPLPKNPHIQEFEVSLQINTGNIIHEKFDDLENLLEFINEHSHDPAKILERIKPKKKSK